MRMSSPVIIIFCFSFVSSFFPSVFFDDEPPAEVAPCSLMVAMSCCALLSSTVVAEPGSSFESSAYELFLLSFDSLL